MFRRRRRSQSDFSEELDAHLALEMDRLRSEGLDEETAYRVARRNFGNLHGAGEQFYESNAHVWLEHLIYDTRHALRNFRRAPAFAAAAILTLALGIGATTSIFTLVHAVLLKSLSVSNPKELYRLGKQTHCCVWGGFSQSGEYSIVSYDLYKYFRDNTQGFAELAAFEAGQVLLGVRRAHTAGVAESHIGEFVSGNYFAMFGLTASTGRTLTPADDRPGAPLTAMMSHRLWDHKYALDPSVIGSTFNFNDRAFTIVGIAPPGFYGDTLRATPPDFFLPIATEPLLNGDSSLLAYPSTHWLDLIGRLKPGANAAAVQAQMRVELQQWLRLHIGEMDANDHINLPKQTLYLSPGGAGITSMREQYEHWLQILIMVSGFVLLIVCSNVASLMLVRGMERRQQTSLSMALGVRTTRLVRQALTESVILSIMGGIAGLAVAFAGTRLILHLAFNSVLGLTNLPISALPSLPILAFAFTVALVTGVIFGIVPAWMATRVDPIEALRGANRSTRQSGSLARKVLVIVQAALALVLLAASGLLTRTLSNLEDQKFGFEQDGRTIVNIDPLLAGYKAEQLTSLNRRIHDAFAAIPGVQSVALCIYSPLSNDSWNDGFFVAGRAAPGPNEDNGAAWDRVTGGYFETTGNAIVKGRPITEEDTATSRHVAVVNEAFARKFFKNEDPIGKHFGRTTIETSREFEIVGVAKDARYINYDLDKPVGAFAFFPASQYTVFPKTVDTVGDVRSHYMHDIIVRMRPGAKLSEAVARRAVATVDANMPVNFVRSLREQVAGNFSQSRLIARLTSLFGILALVLASIGLYGVTAYSAGSRTNEIGVRMALGAQRGNVLALILRGALALIAFGLLVGLPLAVAAGRFLGNQLYGMSPYDARVLLIAVAALSLSTLLAALIPAVRASSISPLQALRAE